jgi:hypothetical protein
MTKNTRRWERGDNQPTERYKLYYCKTFEIPVTEFGFTASGTDPLSPIATVNAHGLSARCHAPVCMRGTCCGTGECPA